MGNGEWVMGIFFRRKGKSLITNYQLPIRNAQCPMPNAQFPMPNSQFNRVRR
ncbi:MAG: hypothetical protein KME31_28535 [Tolypothrix carrinoi HA7290-LM1]|nr:hypothetical protein [Tolypothrix carrinoi HA7290-LM1]